MISDIKEMLDQIVGSVAHLKNAKGAGRAFELYIMCGIASSLAHDHGYEVGVQRSNGTRIGPYDHDRTFIQRGGVPTGLPAMLAGPDNMSTFIFSRAECDEEWEIWNGVQFGGRSGGSHEFDIAIVPHSVGLALRSGSSGGSPVGRPNVAIECKDVQTPGGPDEMRAFIARIYDCTFIESHPKPWLSGAQGSTGIHPGELPRDAASQSFRASNYANLSVLARRTGFAHGATAMTGYYRVQAHGSIVPGSSEDRALTEEITQWIVTNL